MHIETVKMQFSNAVEDNIDNLPSDAYSDHRIRSEQMMKLVILFLLLFAMTFTLFGCADKAPDNPHAVIDDPPSPYEYVFTEECSNGEKYIKIEHIEVSKSYGNVEPAPGGSGYYLILGVSTNMSADDFSNQDNSAVLYTHPQPGPPIMHQLSLVLWDSENKKLVYDIPESDYINYPQLLNSRVADEYSDIHINLIFDCFQDHEYFLVDGTQYSGRYIALNLKYQT